ncbi:thermonuclease family protein [Mesorhizobium sp. M0078]
MDAPESSQSCGDATGFDYPCGRRSAEALATFLRASSPVKCTFVTWDRYRRFVGDCLRADGINVAAWMVEHGQAMDWPRYSRGAYSAQAGEGGDREGRHMGRSLPDALGMARTKWRKRSFVEALWVHQTPSGRTKCLFMRTTAELLSNRLVRRRSLVSRQLFLGRQTRPRQRRGSLRRALLAMPACRWKHPER